MRLALGVLFPSPSSRIEIWLGLGLGAQSTKGGVGCACIRGGVGGTCTSGRLLILLYAGSPPLTASLADFVACHSAGLPREGRRVLAEEDASVTLMTDDARCGSQFALPLLQSCLSISCYALQRMIFHGSSKQ